MEAVWAECALVGEELRKLKSLGSLDKELEDYQLAEEVVWVRELGLPGFVCCAAEERCKKQKVDTVELSAGESPVIVPVRGSYRLRLSSLLSGKVFLAIITSTKRRIELKDLEIYRLRLIRDLQAERYEHNGFIDFAEPLQLRSG